MIYYFLNNLNILFIAKSTMHVSQDMPEHVSRCLVNFSLDEKTSLHRSQYTFSVIIIHYIMPSYNMVTAHHLNWSKTAFGTIPSKQNPD